MEKEIILTEKERELIDALRNFKKSKHNYSYQLEVYVRELFDRMIEDEDED